MKETILDLTFTTIKNLNYFIILPIILIILFWRTQKVNNVAKALTPKNNQNILINFSSTKNILKLFLLIIGSFFLFFSLLSPAWDKKEVNVKQEGRDIFIALDISRSMLAKDLKPNRLEWAKSKIKKLLNLLESDRVGLILFSGSATVYCPLTNDFSTFFMFLDQVDTEIISSGSTSIDQALKVAIEKFNTTPNKKNKLLIIFTDGEDFSSDLANAKEHAHKENLKVFAIGSATTKGATIPLFNKKGQEIGTQLDENGKEVISCLNEGILKALTKNCGGYYIQYTTNDSDLEEITNKVHQFEKEKFEEKKITTYEQQYPYFIAISFICFALEWIL